MKDFDLLLLNPLTLKLLDLYMSKPGSGLLILGSEGAGKYSVAEALASKLLNVDSIEELHKQPFYKQIQVGDKKKEISINQVRQIIRDLKMKFPGKREIESVVLIEDAHYLSPPAQDALLKTLEEPNQNATFILTAPRINSLLPTIVSRIFKIEVLPVSLESAKEFYAGQYSVDQIESAWALSQGYAALMNSLLTSSDDHPLAQAISQAKQLINSSPYETLTLFEQAGESTESIGQILDALSRLYRALHKSAIDRGNKSLAAKLMQKRKTIDKLQVANKSLANRKLLSLSAAVNL